MNWKSGYRSWQDDSPPEEKKPIIDQVTDLAADAAGTLAETAVKAGAKKAREAIAKRLPRPVKKAANTIAKAAKAPKKSAKKTTKKSRKPAKRTKSSVRRKTVGKKMATRVAKKKKARRR
jgi:acyl-CoA reductase-like NAD-dependent aldehyde dehydrogenase